MNWRFYLVLFLTLILGFIIGWGIPTNTKESVKVDTIYTEKPVVEEPVSMPRVWKSSDTGLPVGVVIDGEADNNNSAINWLSIQQADGHMVIAKNIDGQLWGAIKSGDIIE